MFDYIIPLIKIIIYSIVIIIYSIKIIINEFIYLYIDIYILYATIGFIMFLIIIYPLLFLLFIKKRPYFKNMVYILFYSFLYLVSCYLIFFILHIISYIILRFIYDYSIKESVNRLYMFITFQYCFEIICYIIYIIFIIYNI